MDTYTKFHLRPEVAFLRWIQSDVSALAEDAESESRFCSLRGSGDYIQTSTRSLIGYAAGNKPAGKISPP